jgi:O-antigen ligase
MGKVLSQSGLGAWGAKAEQALWLLGVAALILALSLLPLDRAMILVLGTLALGLVLSDPIWALYLAVLSVPVQELVTLPGGLSVTQAALLLVLASLALHTLAHPERPLAYGRIFAPLAFFVWVLALAAVFTPYSRSEALRETLRWATVPLIYLLALRTLAGAPWRAWGLVACLLLAPAATALLGLAQFWYGIGPESFGVGGGRVRAYGTIGQPNSFAGYMNQAWPLATGVAFFALVALLAGAPRRRYLALLLGAGAAAALTSAALLVSFSRGGWLGALGGLAALALAVGLLLPQQLRLLARRALLTATAAGLGLVLLGGGGLLPDALAQRAASLVGSLRLFDAHNAQITPANFAVVERMAHLQAAWHMIEQSPLLGIGPGNYSLAYETPPRAGAAPISVRPWYESRGHAHNYYLHIAAEAGLVGLGAYLILIGTLALQALRAVRHARGWFWRGVAAGGAGVVAAVTVHNLFENLHVLNIGLQLGALWALLVLAEQRAGPQIR